AGHVLLSTWASLFHMMAAMGGGEIGATTIVLMGAFLFLAVWLPCCTSDIVFPLVAVLAVSGPKARRKWLDADGAELVRSLGVQSGDRVLDFGCNWGAYAIPLAQTVGADGEVVAVDRDPEAIRALRRNLEKRAVRNIRIADDWKTVRGEVGGRPFRAILLFDVLHMMPVDERARLYADVREMLAEDGRLAIHPKHTRENQPARHFKERSEAEVRHEIESAGFRLAERREVRLWHGHDQEAGCLLVFAKDPTPAAAPGTGAPTTP
ncbi:MAG: class I SAM-dependent methyltransferase, partial [Lentisphaerae bacterium]|nr:class I SAM-dependent methyltransferase [Lentisphaerota bacterium]